jgi:hypothetical protein
LPLEAGVYNVHFIKNGYQPIVVEDTTAVEGFSILDVELEPYYFIAGRVWADDDYVPSALSFLYKMTEDGTVIDLFAELTGELGWFEYGGLSTAYYIIKAEPNPTSPYYGNYLPTYYGDVLYWEDATVIHLTAGTESADIHLIAATNMPQGGGSIRGTIDNGRDQAMVAGIPVILQLTDSGDATMVYTDIDGDFEFNELGYGSYELFADIPGKSIVPMNITLDESTPSVTGITMVIMEEQIIFLGIEESEFIESLSRPYPNPANSQVNMFVNLKKSSELTITVRDISGRTLLSKDLSLGSSGRVQLDVSAFPAGYYSIQVSDEDSIRIYRSFIKK